MAKTDSPTPPAATPSDAAVFHHPPLRIISATPGFRRAGVSHPAVADHPADTFTEAQLEAFQAEPTLKLMPIPESE